MKAKEAIEIVATSGIAGEIKEAVEFLMNLETENLILRRRCRVLSSGLLCGHCTMRDKCKEQEIEIE